MRNLAYFLGRPQKTGLAIWLILLALLLFSLFFFLCWITMQRMWDGNERCCMNPSRYFGQWSVWLLEPPSSWHVDLKLPEETMGRGKGILHALHVEYERSCSNHACLVCKPRPIRERGMKERRREGLGC